MDDERDDDSLVASLEVNNVNQVTADEVIWVTPKINGHTLIVVWNTTIRLRT